MTALFLNVLLLLVSFQGTLFGAAAAAAGTGVKLKGLAKPINAMISRGAYPIGYSATSTVGQNEKPFLIKAVKYGPLKMVQDVLRVAGVDVNAQGLRGEAALHYAAKRGDEDILASLLRAGAHRNIRNNFGVTPLNAVSYNPGFADTPMSVERFELVVRILLGMEDERLGIVGLVTGNLEIPDTFFGFTPLLAAVVEPPMPASCRPTNEHIKVLLRCGADRDGKDRDRKSLVDHVNEQIRALEKERDGKDWWKKSEEEKEPLRKELSGLQELQILLTPDPSLPTLRLVPAGGLTPHRPSVAGSGVRAARHLCSIAESGVPEEEEPATGGAGEKP